MFGVYTINKKSNGPRLPECELPSAGWAGRVKLVAHESMPPSLHDAVASGDVALATKLIDASLASNGGAHASRNAAVMRLLETTQEKLDESIEIGAKIKAQGRVLPS